MVRARSAGGGAARPGHGRPGRWALGAAGGSGPARRPHPHPHRGGRPGPLAVSVARALVRPEPGVDLIALLAMAGALALGEHLAGAVIALMLSGGQALEAYAGGPRPARAAALAGPRPAGGPPLPGRGARRSPARGGPPGDRLLVKPGEIVPVDGLIEEPAAVLDESALTGESSRSSARRRPGRAAARSTPAVPFELRAAATAAESTYAGIVRLVSRRRRPRRRSSASPTATRCSSCR